MEKEEKSHQEMTIHERHGAKRLARPVAPRAREEPESNSSLYLVMVGMVCLLLVFSVVQTVQIMKLRTNVQTGSAINAVAAGPSVQSAPQAQAPPAQQQMVGGC